MKYVEIILKVLFLAGVVTFFASQEFFLTNICWFLIVSFILGIVLFFNKKQSYGYQLVRREIIMRKVEGVLLVVFAIVFAVLKSKGVI